MIKVAKFGGSSMADENGFLRIAEWLRDDEDIKAVVLSAGGRTDKSKKVTDILVDAWQDISRGKSVQKSLSPFIERLSSDAGRVGLYNKIKDELMMIGQEIECDFSLDFVLSRGEYFYAKLFSEFSGIRFCDSKDLIKFYDDGRLNLGYSEHKIKWKYEHGGRFVTGGFYGSTDCGKIKTFSRGGGDFSGAIISRGLRADEYLNFTDVDGVYQFDPNICNNCVIDQLSFDNIRILGEFGARVLHPASVLSLYGTKTKITVKNTFNKFAKGTVITEEYSGEQMAIASCACRFARVRATGRAHSLVASLAEKVKVIGAVVTTDMARICYLQNGAPIDFGEGVASVDEESVVFYFTASRESDGKLAKILKSLSPLGHIKTDIGHLLIVKKSDVSLVEKKLCEK